MNLHEALAHIRVIPDYPKTGILFQDITPLLSNALAFSTVIEAISELSPEADYVAGIEARGFILASALALKKSLGFIPIRKAGKLPSATFSRSYGLEYGADVIEIHRDALAAESKVLLIDDVLATGGTIDAAIALVADSGASVSKVIVLLELGELGGRAKIAQNWPHVKLEALLQI